MKLGKVSIDNLRRILETVGLRAELDANPLSEEEVVSTNPAIGVPLKTLGFFAFHYTASNVAVAFAKPMYATLNVLGPPSTTDEEMEEVVKSFVAECRKYQVELRGGHTARYEGIEYPLAVSTIIGKRVRPRLNPSPGDKVYLIGTIGAESAWLLGKSIPLEEMTPLPNALKLMRFEQVKLLHDVSEGGVLGALLELSKHYGFIIKVTAPSMPTNKDLPRDFDPLTAPTYGALLAVTSSPQELEAVCRDEGVQCTSLAVIVGKGEGVEYKSKLYSEPPSTPLIELYNPYTPGDPELAQVLLAATMLIKIKDIERFIPEVGANIAYARRGASRTEDVAALDGRIVRTSKGARICGKPSYGSSRHLARVILQATRNNPDLRAAINLKPEPVLLKGLERIGLNPLEVKAVPSECPIEQALHEGSKALALYYRNLPNLEPSLVILGDDPVKLVELVRLALSNIGAQEKT